MKSLKHGILVAVEGVDGSGKSTLAQNLFMYYCDQYTTMLTKEPGGSPLGAFLRTHLQEQTIPTCHEAEFLLFAADRAQHFHESIIPALNKSTLVISDRLADSSLAYQGFGRGLNHAMIQAINAWVMKNSKPTITVYVKVSLETAIERLSVRNQSLTSFEKDCEFFQRVIEGFNLMYKDRTDVLSIDGQQTQEKVMDDAIQRINALLVGYEG